MLRRLKNDSTKWRELYTIGIRNGDFLIIELVLDFAATEGQSACAYINDRSCQNHRKSFPSSPVLAKSSRATGT